MLIYSGLLWWRTSRTFCYIRPSIKMYKMLTCHIYQTRCYCCLLNDDIVFLIGSCRVYFPITIQTCFTEILEMSRDVNPRGGDCSADSLRPAPKRLTSLPDVGPDCLFWIWGEKVCDARTGDRRQ